MGDSDDEYDRRRRDKFRRERSDYDRSRERDERRRGDDWNDREWDRGRERRSRGEYRDYDRNRRERFSPPRHELSPPQKRLRRDWDEHSSDPYHSGYEMPYAGGGGGPTYGPPQPWGHPDVHIMQHHVLPIQARLGSIAELDLGVPPPVMKSFKEFLLSLDDSVDETEAVKRYNDYKLDFRRQQMQDFFLAHKDEEWFRSKYHPDEVGKRRQEARGALQNRLRVFLALMDGGWFDTLLLDIDKADAIVKMLDAAVIKMEGGTEHDLRILEQEEEEEQAGKKEEGPGRGPPDADRKAADKDDKKDDAKQTDGDPPTEDKAKKSEADGEKEEKKEEPEKEAKKVRGRGPGGGKSGDPLGGWGKGGYPKPWPVCPSRAAKSGTGSGAETTASTRAACPNPSPSRRAAGPRRRRRRPVGDPVTPRTPSAPLFWGVLVKRVPHARRWTEHWSRNELKIMLILITMIFIKCLLCVRHCSECWREYHLSRLETIPAPQGAHSLHSHFTDEGTEAQRLNHDSTEHLVRAECRSERRGGYKQIELDGVPVPRGAHRLNPHFTDEGTEAQRSEADRWRSRD
uniref:SERRATE/Ars2 N-terminal domain-containing protein n=1 Tax=Ornithorhynchus anatinus TaxID=9258 RepID=A0A6I8NL63_ORNAN